MSFLLGNVQDYYELRVTVKVPKSAVNPADQHNAVGKTRLMLCRLLIQVPAG